MEPNRTLCLSRLRLAKRGDAAAGDELARSLIIWAHLRLRAYRDLEPDEVAGSFAARLSRDQFALLPEEDIPQLEAYLHRALRNLALNELRSQKRRRWQGPFASSDEEERVADSRSTNPEVIVLGREGLRSLMSAAQRLSAENRQLLLALAGGATHQELAERFSLKPGTLAQRLWSVRKQVRRALDIAEN